LTFDTAGTAKLCVMYSAYVEDHCNREGK